MAGWACGGDLDLVAAAAFYSLTDP